MQDRTSRRTCKEGGFRKLDQSGRGAYKDDTILVESPSGLQWEEASMGGMGTYETGMSQDPMMGSGGGSGGEGGETGTGPVG